MSFHLSLGSCGICLLPSPPKVTEGSWDGADLLLSFTVPERNTLRIGAQSTCLWASKGCCLSQRSIAGSVPQMLSLYPASSTFYWARNTNHIQWWVLFPKVGISDLEGWRADKVKGKPSIVCKLLPLAALVSGTWHSLSVLSFWQFYMEMAHSLPQTHIWGSHVLEQHLGKPWNQLLANWYWPLSPGCRPFLYVP